VATSGVARRTARLWGGGMGGGGGGGMDGGHLVSHPTYPAVCHSSGYCLSRESASRDAVLRRRSIRIWSQFESKSLF